MQFLKKLVLSSLFFNSLGISTVFSQAELPPALPWKGKSESLIAQAKGPWITAVEKSDFANTPNYEETMNWFKKLADASPLLSMISIGKSPEGRDVFMLIASTDKDISAASLKKSTKPLLLAQAGIHAGEIDGKDAGMMLLRDIAYGPEKALLNTVNFLFIPILNVDGHERSSSWNRPNQRGPENMGYRTNSQNLNLNRDYAKLDTREIRAVVQVINDYDPELYMDIHVTDGADYQYDITYGNIGKEGYSPAISNWLEKVLSPEVNKGLTKMGHIPGPLVNAFDDRDFSKGMIGFTGSPRFSHHYGNLRHLPAILVENHSLKPYNQRVLGTYVLLKNVLEILGIDGHNLQDAINSDRSRREKNIPIDWKVPEKEETIVSKHEKKQKIYVPDDSIDFLGISSRIVHSDATGADYVQWQGKAVQQRIAVYKTTEVVASIRRPKGYWIPVSCSEVIERLKTHGIKMTTFSEPKQVAVEMYRISEPSFKSDESGSLPFEGHWQVKAKSIAETRSQTFPAGSVYVSCDQPLGDLAMILLEPNSPDSYFSWGFFPQIFQRTEYIEAYVMEPLITKMLKDDPSLKEKFEQKKIAEPEFAKSHYAMMNWFYQQTAYFDNRYMLYPIGLEKN
ncbi:MAG: M14 family metallopeptidase [Saprospiraceae bacterium]